ncbi:hypothetical protein AVEN_268666-1 [Araneus ventricosus]|uniref:Histone-lysine N-methyltransferase SETMAR n=1 Tax=Araneus ventricosus TaxID=182803 RepID=A0A4Y2VHH6_ARAVE|nr:hypothetical protein AVEN_268666-1 [Araneus ventricosus]
MLRRLSLLHHRQNTGHSRNASSVRVLSDGAILLHDNATPHSVSVTQQLIDCFGWEQTNHPPYSPDLVPSDICLFLNLKRFLSGQRFNDDESESCHNILSNVTGGHFL